VRKIAEMEADEWFILILIDALVSVPLYFTVIKLFMGRTEKLLLNELELYFGIFFVILITSIIVLKKALVIGCVK
jgi:hypothetical protein